MMFLFSWPNSWLLEWLKKQWVTLGSQAPNWLRQGAYHVRYGPFVTKESRRSIDVITQWQLRIKPDIRKECGLIKHGWTDAVEGIVEAISRGGSRRPWCRVVGFFFADRGIWSDFSGAEEGEWLRENQDAAFHSFLSKTGFGGQESKDL